MSIAEENSAEREAYEAEVRHLERMQRPFARAPQSSADFMVQRTLAGGVAIGLENARQELLAYIPVLSGAIGSRPHPRRITEWLQSKRIAAWKLVQKASAQAVDSVERIHIAVYGFDADRVEESYDFSRLLKTDAERLYPDKTVVLGAYETPEVLKLHYGGEAWLASQLPLEWKQSVAGEPEIVIANMIVPPMPGG